MLIRAWRRPCLKYFLAGTASKLQKRTIYNTYIYVGPRYPRRMALLTQMGSRTTVWEPLFYVIPAICIDLSPTHREKQNSVRYRTGGFRLRCIDWCYQNFRTLLQNWDIEDSSWVRVQDKDIFSRRVTGRPSDEGARSARNEQGKDTLILHEETWRILYLSIWGWSRPFIIVKLHP